MAGFFVLSNFIIMEVQKYFRYTLILFLSIILNYTSYAQKLGISVGPTISLDNESFSHDGRKGFGVSLEIYYKLFPHSGLRVYSGYDNFNTPKISGDRVENIPFRIGYQYFLSKNRIILWGDAGLGLLNYPYYGTYGGFSFSAGGGYNFLLNKKSYLQLQGMYSYINDTDPFYPGSFYAWYTFRVAYGVNSNKK
jgi:hypothetical protein